MVHIQNVQRQNVQRQNVQIHKVPAPKRPSSKTSKIQNVLSLKTSQASKRPSSKTSKIQNVQASKRPKPQNVPNALEYETKLCMCMLSYFYFLLLFSVNGLHTFAQLYKGTVSRDILKFFFIYFKSKTIIYLVILFLYICVIVQKFQTR